MFKFKHLLACTYFLFCFFSYQFADAQDTVLDASSAKTSHLQPAYQDLTLDIIASLNGESEIAQDSYLKILFEALQENPSHFVLHQNLYDLNHDDQQELFIIFENEIMAVYTLLDNQAQLLLQADPNQAISEIDIYQEGLLSQRISNDNQDNWRLYSINTNAQALELQEEWTSIKEDSKENQTRLQELNQLSLPEQVLIQAQTQTAASEPTLEMNSGWTSLSQEISYFPFAVPCDQLTNQVEYIRYGSNIPRNIWISSEDNQVEFRYLSTEGEIQQTQAFTIQDTYYIDTKEIEIFSADGSGTRMINVNSTLKVGTPLDESGNGAFENIELYFFYNRDGGISMATPNFAGNVAPEQENIMLEYILVE